jgi:uncharacterized protein YifE (UPF0438 family)
MAKEIKRYYDTIAYKKAIARLDEKMKEYKNNLNCLKDSASYYAMRIAEIEAGKNDPKNEKEKHVRDFIGYNSSAERLETFIETVYKNVLTMLQESLDEMRTETIEELE